MVFGEDGEVSALVGGVTDELSGALEVRGGIERLKVGGVVNSVL